MEARVDSVQVVTVAEQSGTMYGKQSCDIAGFLSLAHRLQMDRSQDKRGTE
jgi:hypothetical protein